MLKQCFVVLLTLTVLLKAGAQNNLVVLNPAGNKFILYVDDKKVNDSAQAQVKATAIFDDTCRIRMVFSNSAINTFSAKVFLTEAGKTVIKKEFTYSLEEENGKRRLRFVSVNFVQSDTGKPQKPEVRINTIFTNLEKEKAEQDKLNEKYPSPSTCVDPVSDSLLERELSIFRENHIEMNRLKDAKWFVSHNCINTTQLCKLMDVFNRQDAKVKIAIFSYDYIEDHRNFLQTLEAVKYATEKEELKNFFNKKIEK